MDEIRENRAGEESPAEQVVFFSPELIQAAKTRQERLGALRAAAETGDSAAMLELGLYYLGEIGGAPRDPAAAFDWLSRLEPDNAVGCYYLSYCYDQGVGVAADPVKAAELLHAAAEQRFTPAVCALGLDYEKGRGVEQDLQKAAALYRQAAEDGFPMAMCNLGVLYMNGQGVAQDEERGVALFQQAAELQLPRAQYFLGLCYEEGNGVPQDLRKARLLYEQAAEKKHAEAICSLGLLYYHGVEVEQDREKAMSLFLEAAEQGLPRAQFFAARCYDIKRGKFV